MVLDEDVEYDDGFFGLSDSGIESTKWLDSLACDEQFDTEGKALDQEASLVVRLEFENCTTRLDFSDRSLDIGRPSDRSFLDLFS